MAPEITPQVSELDQDLQIVHATLATLVPEVERYSGDAAAAMHAAIRQVESAHHTLAVLQKPRVADGIAG